MRHLLVTATIASLGCSEATIDNEKMNLDPDVTENPDDDTGTTDTSGPNDTGGETEWTPPPSPVGIWQLEAATAETGIMTLSADGGSGDLTVSPDLDASLEVELDVDSFVIDVQLSGTPTEDTSGRVIFDVSGSFEADPLLGTLGRLHGTLSGEVVCTLTTEATNDVMACDGVLAGEIVHRFREMPISTRLVPRFVRTP